MTALAWALIGAGALAFLYNVRLLWGNTAQGLDMGASIVFHQGNLVAALLAGAGLAVHPALDWWWGLVPPAAAFVLGVPLMSALLGLMGRRRG